MASHLLKINRSQDLRTILSDIRCAFRGLLQRPGFSAAVVLTLALGIGVNTAIFSLYNAVVLRPLPVEHPDRLVRLLVLSKKETRPGFSYPEYVHFQKGPEAFETVVAQSWGTLQLTDAGTGDVEPIPTLFVSASYFSVVSCPMTLGRVFTPEDDRPGSELTAILGYGAWRKRFGADPEIVGRPIVLNGRSFTVIGVAGSKFTGLLGHPPDLFVPVTVQSVLKPGLFQRPDSSWLQLFATLKAGTEIQEAVPLVNAAATAFFLTQATDDDATIAVVPAGGGGPKAVEFAIVMVAVMLVLVIACANVSNLVMSRVISRRKEFAVRISLGARRFDLICHCLAESLVLALLSGAVGLLVGYWMIETFLASTGIFYEALDLRPDIRVLGYGLFLALAAVFFFGSGPALRGTRMNANQVIKEEACLSGLYSPWRRNVLVTCQVAASLLLLVTAGLLLKGLHLVQSGSTGLVAEGVVHFELDLESAGYDSSKARLFHQTVLANLHSLPGIKSVSYASKVPCSWQRDVEHLSSENLRVGVNSVSNGYFDTLGMTVLRGRDFTYDDGASESRVAIVSESLARRLWGNQDPVGQTVQTTELPFTHQVIGVVNDLTLEEPRASLYRPVVRGSESSTTVLIKASGDPRAVIKAVRLKLQAFDQGLQPDIALLQRSIDAISSEARADAILAGSLGLLSLALAVTGLYGVVSFASRRRAREVGIRLALGARPADILSMMVWQGIRPVAIGIVLGIVLAGLASRLLISNLYGLSPTDLGVYLGLSAFLALVALGAIFLPARRAARADPLQTLRWE